MPKLVLDIITYMQQATSADDIFVAGEWFVLAVMDHRLVAFLMKFQTYIDTSPCSQPMGGGGTIIFLHT